mmetsp:Transcript_587/g.2377  ORF Transcript_587/g.2377 Transcript_587/m.2377 type:complete len:295 (-) Transcript_587:314-1198(-)
MLCHLRPAERVAASKHLPQGAAHRPPIHRLRRVAHVLGARVENFRRHEVRRANVSPRKPARVNRATEAKVNQRDVSVGIQAQVFRLQVAVRHASGVQAFKASDQLRSIKSRHGLGEPLARRPAEVGIELPALKKLQHETLVRGSLRAPVELHHERAALQFGQGLGFLVDLSPEAPLAALADALDGHNGASWQVEAGKHGPEAPGADLHGAVHVDLRGVEEDALRARVPPAKIVAPRLGSDAGRVPTNALRVAVVQERFQRLARRGCEHNQRVRVSLGRGAPHRRRQVQYRRAEA